jgi:ribose 5-phosphate isomerase B
MIFIASDHAGFELKEKIKSHLASRKILYEDLGAGVFDPGDDYPDFAILVAQRVSQQLGEGILICDTGIGMDIVANKFRGVRAALCLNEFMARRAKEHNHANILVLGAELDGAGVAKGIVDEFLNAKFSKEKRHLRRIEKIQKLEK